MILGPQNVKTTHGKSWPSKLFSCEQVWPHFEKCNGHHGQIGQIFKYDLDAQKLEMLQLGSSNLHKRYMARKVRMTVFCTSFKNKMAVL